MIESRRIKALSNTQLRAKAALKVAGMLNADAPPLRRIRKRYYGEGVYRQGHGRSKI
jgi:hypothetical protein